VGAELKNKNISTFSSDEIFKKKIKIQSWEVYPPLHYTTQCLKILSESDVINILLLV
jgi:hypothetical protein